MNVEDATVVFVDNRLKCVCDELEKVVYILAFVHNKEGNCDLQLFVSEEREALDPTVDERLPDGSPDSVLLLFAGVKNDHTTGRKEVPEPRSCLDQRLVLKVDAQDDVVIVDHLVIAVRHHQAISLEGPSWSRHRVGGRKEGGRGGRGGRKEGRKGGREEGRKEGRGGREKRSCTRVMSN